MTLIDLVKNINDVDQESIIFISNLEDWQSDIILSYAEEDDGGVKEQEGVSYKYLIEVFLAKEFIDDWVASLDSQPNHEEIAKRLFDYSINDA